MTDTHPRLSIETVLGLLTDPQRRALLHELAEAPDGTTVDQLLGRCRGADASDATDDPRLALHHVHLPMLAEADVLEYGADDGTVRPGSQFRRVVSLLRTVERDGGEAWTCTS